MDYSIINKVYFFFSKFARPNLLNLVYGESK
jgi:hypothetical protein